MNVSTFIGELDRRRLRKRFEASCGRAGITLDELLLRTRGPAVTVRYKLYRWLIDKQWSHDAIGTLFQRRRTAITMAVQRGDDR